MTPLEATVANNIRGAVIGGTAETPGGIVACMMMRAPADDLALQGTTIELKMSGHRVDRETVVVVDGASVEATLRLGDTVTVSRTRQGTTHGPYRCEEFGEDSGALITVRVSEL